MADQPTPILPRRIIVALTGKRALYLAPHGRIADEQAVADARTLLDLGFRSDEFTVERVAGRARVTVKAAGAILYLGGPRDRLEERIRGMSVAHLDGRDLIDPFAADLIVRQS